MSCCGSNNIQSVSGSLSRITRNRVSVITERRQVLPRITGSVDFPSVTTQAKNLIAATGRALGAVLTGERVLSTKEEIERREGICKGCQFMKNGWCQICGCQLEKKVKLATEHCPKNYW